MVLKSLRPNELSQDNSDQFYAHKHAIDLLMLHDDKHNVYFNNNPFLKSITIQKGYYEA